MTIEDIKKILVTIPQDPGCYQYFDSKGTIIYVGKAKNLRKRVSSYFKNDIEDTKTRLLVRAIRDLKYIVVNTEHEALLLENALIKEHQPRYNVLLKDDKTYPSIVIKNEAFPRVMVTRNIIRDGSQYFGPYPNVGMANATLSMISDLYPIRTCKLDLNEHKIREGKYSVCLKYHIKKCKAPCVSKQSKEDYDINIKEISSLLKGNLHDVIDLYEEEMYRLSEELRFEEAQIYKERLNYLRNYEVKHTVAPNNINNVDVFSYDRDDSVAYINYMHIAQGLVNRAMTYEYKLGVDENDTEIFSTAILDIRLKMNSNAREIIVPFDPEWLDKSININIPKIGDKKKLLELSEKNVRLFKLDKYKQSEKLNPEQSLLKTLSDLRSYLKTDNKLLHIECFDNSNIQGSNAVAACVVFKKGKASKKDYRKFHIKTVEGVDDYASMSEVVFRHYNRYLESGKELPDLIIADGSKGQINAIRKSLDRLGLNIDIAGLVKDERHRSRALIWGENLEEINIKHDSPSFRFLEQIQNEVHRFAINFHRDERSKSQLDSELDHIDGIGIKTKDLLLSKISSVKRIKELSFEELSSIIGKSKAKKIYEHFRYM